MLRIRQRFVRTATFDESAADGAAIAPCCASGAGDRRRLALAILGVLVTSLPQAKADGPLAASCGTVIDLSTGAPVQHGIGVCHMLCVADRRRGLRVRR